MALTEVDAAPRFSDSRLLNWWADRGVKTKVLSAVGVAAAAAAATGIVGTVALNSASQTAEDLYRDNVTSVISVGKMIDDVQTLRVLSRNAALAAGPTDAQAALDKIPTVLAQYEADQAAYSEFGMTPEKQVVVDEAAAAVDEWASFLDGTLAPLALSGDTAGWVTANNENLLLTEVSQSLTELRDAESDAAMTASEAAVATASDAGTTMMVLLGAGILAAVGAALFVAAGLGRGVRCLQDVAEALAAGDLTKASAWGTKCEMGQMSTALDKAVANLRSVITAVGSSADAVAASSEELSASSAQISAGAEETAAQSGVVSGAAEEVSRSVQTVAAGAEEMGASIREIASNAAEASQVAARAVTAAETTSA
ncbi:MCP four helix bundle domain-containing protein, partial [Blastococcus xanthinilyticus]